MTIAQEEIFGPVLSILPYDSEDEAVQIANDTIYGLAGGVWSADADRACALQRKTARTGQGRRKRRAKLGFHPPPSSAATNNPA